MNKFAAETSAVVHAMQKIASAYGLPLSPQVAHKIAEMHDYSPVLIIKTATKMTPEENLKWQTYRANLFPNMLAGSLPVLGPIISTASLPGWGGSWKHTLLPNILGSALGAGAGYLTGNLLGYESLTPTLTGAAIGGALGSYVGGRHYAPMGENVPAALPTTMPVAAIMPRVLTTVAGATASSQVPRGSVFK